LDLLGPIFATCPEGLAGHAAAEQNEAGGVEKSAWGEAAEAAEAVAWTWIQHDLAQRRFHGRRSGRCRKRVSSLLSEVPRQVIAALL